MRTNLPLPNSIARGIFLRSIFHFIKSFWAGVYKAILGNPTKIRQHIKSKTTCF